MMLWRGIEVDASIKINVIIVLFVFVESQSICYEYAINMLSICYEYKW